MILRNQINMTGKTNKWKVIIILKMKYPVVYSANSEIKQIFQIVNKLTMKISILTNKLASLLRLTINISKGKQALSKISQ